MNLVFLHGFLSSPQSKKCVLTSEFITGQFPHWSFSAPQIPLNPELIEPLLDRVVGGLKGPVGLIGSSLGGYFADYLAQKYGFKAVLINPATRPYESILSMGDRFEHPLTGELLTIQNHYLDLLKGFKVTDRQYPERYLLLTQTGDEVLNYRHALEDLDGVEAVVEEGGDHHFQHYQRHLARICEFLQAPV